MCSAISYKFHVILIILTCEQMWSVVCIDKSEHKYYSDWYRQIPACLCVYLMLPEIVLDNYCGIYGALLVIVKQYLASYLLYISV